MPTETLATLFSRFVSGVRFRHPAACAFGGHGQDFGGPTQKGTWIYSNYNFIDRLNDFRTDKLEHANPLDHKDSHRLKLRQTSTLCIGHVSKSGFRDLCGTPHTTKPSRSRGFAHQGFGAQAYRSRRQGEMLRRQGLESLASLPERICRGTFVISMPLVRTPSTPKNV